MTMNVKGSVGLTSNRSDATIRDSALALLATATEDDLETKRDPRAEEKSKACYLRMLEHSNVHIRWIWQLQGAIGLPKRAVQR